MVKKQLSWQSFQQKYLTRFSIYDVQQFETVVRAISVSPDVMEMK